MGIFRALKHLLFSTNKVTRFSWNRVNGVFHRSGTVTINGKSRPMTEQELDEEQRRLDQELGANFVDDDIEYTREEEEKG